MMHGLEFSDFFAHFVNLKLYVPEYQVSRVVLQNLLPQQVFLSKPVQVCKL